jgi:hypothetical protein
MPKHEKGKPPWAVAVIVGIITFIFSLVEDFITRKDLDYGYAILLAVIFGGIFFALQFLFNHRMKRRPSRRI